VKVLGIDPGTAACGYGIVHESGGRLRVLDYGSWTTPASERPELRLRTIFDAVGALIALHGPDAVALEESFVGADARTALSVGQARGAVLVAAARAGVACAEYAPARVKQAVCGYGADARGRRARGGDLPRARATAAARGGDAVIARLRGRPVGRTAAGLVLDVGGVGYLVAATPRALRLADGVDEATLVTYLHVREDALQLYGFADADERELFVRLLSVSGIGPKVALAILSGSTPAELRRAIALEDSARFQAIPGIGRKTAERIVLELKGAFADANAPSCGPAQQLVARDALVELGWSVVEAERALADVDPELPAEERIRLALRRAA
jgi:Holliday junction DNA helicase RuvA